MVYSSFSSNEQKHKNRKTTENGRKTREFYSTREENHSKLLNFVISRLSLFVSIYTLSDSIKTSVVAKKKFQLYHFAMLAQLFFTSAKTDYKDLNIYGPINY